MKCGGGGGWGAGFMEEILVLHLTSGQDTFYFNTRSETKNVVEKMETRLDCDVSDRRHIYFQWTQAGKPVVNTTRKYQEDSNLRILRVLRGQDEGPFQCVATNYTTGFSLQSQEYFINVLFGLGKGGGKIKTTKEQGR
ncbi:hypothetical protein Btru_010465 [Bulinus truncatus]|nr:hypothetical protein Btru_010465 [Bulinus truncatus]